LNNLAKSLIVVLGYMYIFEYTHSARHSTRKDLACQMISFYLVWLLGAQNSQSAKAFYASDAGWSENH